MDESDKITKKTVFKDIRQFIRIDKEVKVPTRLFNKQIVSLWRLYQNEIELGKVSKINYTEFVDLLPLACESLDYSQARLGKEATETSYEEYLLDYNFTGGVSPWVSLDGGVLFRGKLDTEKLRDYFRRSYLTQFRGSVYDSKLTEHFQKRFYQLISPVISFKSKINKVTTSYQITDGRGMTEDQKRDLRVYSLNGQRDKVNLVIDKITEDKVYFRIMNFFDLYMHGKEEVIRQLLNHSTIPFKTIKERGYLRMSVDRSYFSLKYLRYGIDRHYPTQNIKRVVYETRQTLIVKEDCNVSCDLEEVESENGRDPQVNFKLQYGCELKGKPLLLHKHTKAGVRFKDGDVASAVRELAGIVQNSAIPLFKSDNGLWVSNHTSSLPSSFTPNKFWYSKWSLK